MEVIFTSSGETGVLSISGDMVIDEALELKSALSDALGKVSSLQIDLSGVSRVDLSSLQLFCSVHTTAVDAEKTVTLTNATESFTRYASDAGFSRHLPCSRKT